MFEDATMKKSRKILLAFGVIDEFSESKTLVKFGAKACFIVHIAMAGKCIPDFVLIGELL